MSKTIVTEGKTTNEAIEKGLKELRVSRNCVDIKVIENDDKRSFFSILAPRVVKVELTLKDNLENKDVLRKRKEIVLSLEEQDIVKNNIKNFLDDFVEKIPGDINFDINVEETAVKVNLFNKDLGYLIGYRGETLYSLQNILSVIASKGIDKKVRLFLDIEGYKEKREKILEDLAEKVAKSVIKNKKSVTLEPMKPYERKVIHSKLQNHKSVETVSIGEEPHRRIVISLKNINK